MTSILHTKINSICIVEKQNKASKRQQGEYFHDIGNYFSHKAKKAQTAKKISDKLDYLNLRMSFIKRSH